MGEYVSLPAFKWVIGLTPFFFEHFGGYFVLIRVIVAKIRVKKVFTDFETGFTAMAVIF